MTEVESTSMARVKVRRIWKKFIGIASIISIFVIACFLSGGFVILLLLNRGLPSIQTLRTYEPKQVSEVLSEHGEVIGEFFVQKRFVLKDFPKQVKEAFIAAEDSNFYYHRGVDFIGIARALYVNLTSTKKHGGSTITQQVTRALLLSPEKTYSRKLREIVLAWQIENYLTKDEILNLYLNQIYLGSGAYGVEAAARTYFGKSVTELNLSEAAILGGLPQSPSRYSPSKNPERVKRRQLYVLKQMLKNNFITADDYASASKETVFIQPHEEINRSISPYFTEYVRQYVMNKYGSQSILENGYKIYTTLDVDMNRYAQNELRKGLSDLEKRQGYQGPLKHVKPSETAEYFKGRSFEDHDEEEPLANQELEVSVKEAAAAGEIRMRPPRKLEVGDWIEGVVTEVRDDKKDALVEYEPKYFARVQLEDLKWAHERDDPDQEGQVIHTVTKVSDVLHVGDVIPMSVKAILEDVSKPVEAQLEQKTEVEGAILSVDPRNGYVKAMVGGYDFNRSQFNRATQAKRQPGSVFKPIIYATALDLGFTPASILQDSPITFENQADQEKWRPANFDQKFIGDTTLRNSLLASRNTTTIRLLNEVGIDAAITYARRLGIESPLTRDFTLALGSSVVTMQEILQPYIVFATGGYRRKPIFIKRVMDRAGNILEENMPEDFTASTPDAIKNATAQLKKEIASLEFSKQDDAPSSAPKDEGVSFLQGSEGQQAQKQKRQVVTSPLRPGQVLSSETSFLMSYLLKENVLYGSGQRARELDRPAAGKTGTTEENRDAWFIGFTPDLVTGVWVGYDDLRILGKAETGSRAAVPIWRDYMIKAVAPFPKTDFITPANIEFARIESKTGGLASPKSKTGIFEAFVKGTAPTKEIAPQENEMDLYQRDQ